MTREEIEAKWEGMTPRERDAWIATDVMELDESQFHFDAEMGISERTRYNEFIGDDVWEPFNPSTDISAAWEVFMKFDTPSLKKNFDVDDNDYYLCKIGGIIEFGKTAPEAICKAALLAVLEG